MSNVKKEYFGPDDVVDLTTRELWEHCTFDGCRFLGKSNFRYCRFTGDFGKHQDPHGPPDFCSIFKDRDNRTRNE